MESINTRLRLPLDLYRKLKVIAERERRSLHNLIIHLLEQATEGE